MSDPMLAVTLYRCSECEQWSAAEHWNTLSALLLRKVRLQVQRGEVDADDVWIDDEMMACPRCRFEHHDDENTSVEECTAEVGVPDQPADEAKCDCDGCNRIHRTGGEDALRTALLRLSDTLDPEEGPVILAWSVDKLAERLAQELRKGGVVPTKGEPEPATCKHGNIGPHYIACAYCTDPFSGCPWSYRQPRRTGNEMRRPKTCKFPVMTIDGCWIYGVPSWHMPICGLPEGHNSPHRASAAASEVPKRWRPFKRAEPVVHSDEQATK